MTDDVRSFYTVLGVTERASGPEIRIAYLNLARSLHPDRQQGRAPAEIALAERRMREVNEAYAVLGDERRRHSYDHGRTPPPSGGRSTGSRPGSPGSGAAAGPPPAPPRRPSGPRPDNPERFDADPAWRSHLGPDDPDEGVEVTPVVAFLLRRGPLLAILVIAALLFISTAYAGAPDTPSTPTPTTVCTAGPPGTGGGAALAPRC